MLITVHVNGYYDWEPVPADVLTTTPDFKKAIDQQRVKPGSNGQWLMRVTKKAVTHTDVALPEGQLIAMVIQEMCRGDRQPLTRLQCAARYLSRHVMDHHAHKSWFEEFEVNDDGPDQAMFTARIGEHVACGNISEDDVPALLAAYLTPIAPGEHVTHFHSHFGVKPEAIAKSAARRAVRDAAREAIAARSTSEGVTQ